MIRALLLVATASAAALAVGPAEATPDVAGVTPDGQSLLSGVVDGSHPAFGGLTDTSLSDVAAVSSQSVWAVGEHESGGRSEVLVQHWDGSSWSKSPAIAVGRSSAFGGVDASSDSDVWAVGEMQTRQSDVGLVEHWTGSAWSRVSVPGKPDSLTSVAVASSTNAWAVGAHQSLRGNNLPLILHWNGIRWNVVPSPRPTGVNSALNSVDITSPTDIWAAGIRQVATGGEESLLEHWDGQAWRIATTANPGRWVNQLLGSRGYGTGEAWAVGDYSNRMRQRSKTLIEHLDAAGAWRTVKPPIDQRMGELDDVTGTSASDVWLVGLTFTPNEVPLTLHWNGSRLSNVRDPGRGEASLLIAADALASNDVWAVGYYYSAGHGGRVLPLHQQWNGHRWINR